MTNEYLNPPETDESFDSFHDSYVDEAEGLALEDILDNGSDTEDLVTMEQLPRGLDMDERFKNIVMGLAGHSKFKIDRDKLLKSLGEIWWLHMKEIIDSDTFNERVNEMVIDMYREGEY